jgi:hypothetical protein
VFRIRSCTTSIHHTTYVSDAEGDETKELESIANADLLRPLYIALIMGPLGLFREESLIYTHRHEWQDHTLYLVSLRHL